MSCECGIEKLYCKKMCSSCYYKDYDKSRRNKVTRRINANKRYHKDIEKSRQYDRDLRSKNIVKFRLRENAWKKAHPEVSLRNNINYMSKLGKIFDMNSSEYLHAFQSWSLTIKKLDNYMCKNCDSTENLNAHHIQPKSLFPELSLDLDNGITLCVDCHESVHKFKIYL